MTSISQALPSLSPVNSLGEKGDQGFQESNSLSVTLNETVYTHGQLVSGKIHLDSSLAAHVRDLKVELNASSHRYRSTKTQKRDIQSHRFLHQVKTIPLHSETENEDDAAPRSSFSFSFRLPQAGRYPASFEIANGASSAKISYSCIVTADDALGTIAQSVAPFLFVPKDHDDCPLLDVIVPDLKNGPPHLGAEWKSHLTELKLNRNPFAQTMARVALCVPHTKTFKSDSITPILVVVSVQSAQQRSESSSDPSTILAKPDIKRSALDVIQSHHAHTAHLHSATVERSWPIMSDEMELESWTGGPVWQSQGKSGRGRWEQTYCYCMLLKGPFSPSFESFHSSISYRLSLKMAFKTFKGTIRTSKLQTSISFTSGMNEERMQAKRRSLTASPNQSTFYLGTSLEMMIDHDLHLSPALTRITSRASGTSANLSRSISRDSANYSLARSVSRTSRISASH